MGRDSRCVHSFVSNIDERSKRHSEEIHMRRISQRGDMKRRSNEGFEEFWRMFERLTNKRAESGIQWPGKALFQKSLVSPNMADDRKSLARATMELHDGKETTLELRRLTGKLVDNAIRVFDDIYNINDVDGGDGSSRAEYTDDIGELRDSRKTTNKNRGVAWIKPSRMITLLLVSTRVGADPMVSRRWRMEGAVTVKVHRAGGANVRTFYRRKQFSACQWGKVVMPQRRQKEKQPKNPRLFWCG